MKRRYNIKVKNKGWFKKGIKPVHSFPKGSIPWNKGLMGTHFSLSTEFKIGQKPWNKGKIYEQIKGKKHPNWKGDNVGYNALHTWIIRNLGSPSYCKECGTKNSKRFIWHNIDRRYLRNKKDWQRLCSKCHVNIHKNWEVRWKKHFVH